MEITTQMFQVCLSRLDFSISLRSSIYFKLLQSVSPFSFAMAVAVSENMFPLATRSALHEVYDDLHQMNLLVKKESLEKEKQISVDPISLREPSFNLMLPPVVTSLSQAPPLPPAKPKFLSCSLPNSATSSPRFSSILSKKKWKNETQASPRQVENLVRQHSVTSSRFFSMQDSFFSRSKSCGEGRICAPSDELDLCFHNKSSETESNNVNHHHLHHQSSFSKAEIKKTDSQEQEEFKCGALCLFLPGFVKAKPVRARKVAAEEAVVMENVISRTVSLEKFECGSWASSAIVPDHDEDGDSTNLYFDLPLELIRNNANDTHCPINAAFVFDKDRKGVLKTGSGRSTARKSHESGRHVRFLESTPSSPASCITPRLRKAREDFNAFLEAQSA